MGWSIRTYDLANISSFESAEQHWNSAKAWKNENAMWRPLAGQRKRHMRIEQRLDEAYDCVLYWTALVTYWKNGDAKLETHDSQSSLLFAQNMAPFGCTPLRHRGEMFWEIRTPEGRVYHKGTIYLERVEGGWNVVNAATKKPEMEWVLDRKKAAQVRKTLKPYIDWHELTSRLMGSMTWVRYGSDYDKLVQKLLNEPTNHEAYPEFAKFLNPSQLLFNTAYRLAGAHTRHPVPFDRLPRKSR